ncbi:MAG: asparagine synthase (glutamine-hydrolyzing) [Anaerolineaceae bacterium]|nr:asparagine synthase (glutamine-hydrolyzing) [Anaerolineaceae bacterium]
MCGITGFWDQSQCTNEKDFRNILSIMNEKIFHRGPDQNGMWFNAQDGIGFGFRRLAIQDLSPTGHQPMHSADGRFTIIFNGEIYNFNELRNELLALGYPFRGVSDTEVILAAISHWGIEKSISRLNGMFAIALWDFAEKCLYLIRDRIGIKPLYYGWKGKTLLFGSELKSLRTHPRFQNEINRNALHLLLTHNYIPGPSTIYEDIFKLKPGTYLQIKADGSSQQKVYWSLNNAVSQGLAHPFPGSKEEAIDILDSMLRTGVRDRMIADVPLGAFLSGGIDSSLIVAIMQTQSNHPIRSFSIGFHEDKFNEAIHARRVAQHLGTDHTELYVTTKEAQEVIPLLPKYFDEPFADSSQIPTYLVSKLAKNNVTVALSGDGGDELFAGYNRYVLTQKLYQYNFLRFLPDKSRVSLLKLPKEIISRIPSFVLGNSFQHRRKANISFFADKLINILGKQPTRENIYHRIISVWNDSEIVAINGCKPNTVFDRMGENRITKDFLQRAMLADMLTYLPDDILTKVDRASMAVSLEVRTPLLDDHQVVEFAWTLPNNFKLRGKTRKWLLKELLYRYVPKSLIDRPKMGFGVPVGKWLRTDLRDWAENLLDEKRIKNEGYFDPIPIRNIWGEHLKNQGNWQYPLWGILMFESWLDEYIN